MDAAQQSTEKKSDLLCWWEQHQAAKAARQTQLKAEAFEMAKLTAARISRELAEQESEAKAARKAKRAATAAKDSGSTRDVQYSSNKEEQSSSPPKPVIKQEDSLFITPFDLEKESTQCETPPTKVTTLYKRKADKVTAIEPSNREIEDGKPKPVIAASLAPAKRKRCKSERPSERTPVATNASIKAPLNRMPGLSKPAPTGLPRSVPDWYHSVDASHNRFRSDSLTLRNLKTLSDKSMLNDTSGMQFQQACGHLRDFLHQMALFDFAGKEREIIKRSMLLTDGTFETIMKRPFPLDIRELANSLERRWWHGDTDPNLMRGIKKNTSKTKDGNDHIFHALDPEFNFRVPPNDIGHGKLMIGQWWPLQICAVRDGAHGEIEAGIHGSKNDGAISVVVSGGGYANIDEGDTIQYCGTTNVKNIPSANTKLMLLSYEKRQPVRVLRSSKANSKYSPSTGIRYEGLYKITAYEIIDIDLALHRFTLQRKKDQPPVQYTGAAARPNRAEIQAMERDKELRAMAS